MHNLVAYIKGPESEQSFLEWLTGRPGRLVYRMNPQFYLQGNSTSVENYDVYKLEYDPDEEPSEEELEGRVEDMLREIIGPWLAVGKIIIPPHQIKISCEYSED